MIVIEGRGATAPATKTESGNTISKTLCDTVADYPQQCGEDGSSYIIADFFNDRVVACGGDKNDDSCYSDNCYYMDCIAQKWVEFNKMPMAVSVEAAEVVQSSGKDAFWWVTGGLINGGIVHR